MKLTLPIYLLGIFSVLYTHSLFGQGLCSTGGGGFDVTPPEGCAPLTVTFTNTVTNPVSVDYALDYKPNVPADYSSRTSWTYSSPGTFTILQRVFLNTGTIATACRQVRVYESRPVTAQYTSCGGGKINLVIDNDRIAQSYDQYEVDWGDGQVEVIPKGTTLSSEHTYTNTSVQPIIKVSGLYTSQSACTRSRVFADTISFQQAQLGSIEIQSLEMRGDGTVRVTYQGVTAIPTEIKYKSNGGSYIVDGKRSSGGLQPYDIKGLNPNQIYNVVLSSQDLCQGTRDSKVVNTVTLSGQSTEGKNVLRWSQYPDADGFTGYDLLRDGTVIKSFASISEITYTDEDVSCGSYSEYQLIAKIGSVHSVSVPVGVRTEIASPQPISKGSVSVLSENSVLIKANVPGAGSNNSYSLTIEKEDAATGTWRKIITLFNQNEYSDISVKTSESSYCYRVSYENSCGQKVPASAPICTILLKKNLTTLTWNEQLPILGGISGYEVSQTGSSGTNTVIPVQMNRQYTVSLNAQSDLEYNFMVRATSQDDEFESLSNIVNYKRSAGVFVPDAFSPNGDGFNDILEAKSTQLQSFSFSVMNRWGQVVFHSDDIAVGWDGTIEGSNAPVGSYVYKMTFVDDIDQTVEKSGTFMLIR